MDVSRREALAGVAASSVVFHGLPTRGGLRLEHVREERLGEMLDALDERIELFRVATMTPDVVERLGRRGLPPDTFHAMFAGLLTTRLVRDLPERHQVQPIVQERLHGRLMGVGQAALDLRAMLRSFSAEDLRRIGARLAVDPSPVRQVKQAMEPWFGPDAVEPERREQVEAALRQVQWELSNGDPVAFVNEQISQIDRFEAMSDRLLERERHREGDAALGEDGGEPEGEPVVAEAAPAASPMDPCGAAIKDLHAAHDRPRSPSLPHGGGPNTSAARRQLRGGARAICTDRTSKAVDPRFDAWMHDYLPAGARRCAVIGASLTGLGLVTLPVLVGICILTPAVILLFISLILLLASAES